MSELETLRELLDAVNSPGTFAHGFEDSKAVFPGLCVEGFGLVALPLSQQQGAALQQICCMAPFGKGEKTLWDASVRSTWQVDASKITCSNPDWQDYVQRVALTMADQLGVPPETKVAAELYKLLLYQEGDHFSAHRDTEKSPGMFATLTIILPSTYQGGELIVFFGNEKKVFDFGRANGYSTCCAAFYADCKHELRPVQHGYRLALVYNMLNVSTGPVPQLRDCSEQIHQIAREIEQWAQDEDAPERGIYVLGHKYTEDGLAGLTTLKNRDRALATILQKVALEVGVDIYLAAISKTETGSASGGGWTYHSRRCDRCCDEPADPNDYSMEDVHDMHYSIKNWMCLDGSQAGFRECEFDVEEVMQVINVDQDERCRESDG